MQGLDELHKRYASKGLLVASVVVQNRAAEAAGPADAALWKKELGLEMPVWADSTGRFFRAFDPASVLPMVYVFDRDGTVAWVRPGGAPEKLRELERVVRRLLGE